MEGIMNIHHLRVFVSVASNRNMSKTAQEMRLTQPAVSQCIASLELEIGSSLFSRQKRTLELTPKGVLFYQHALSILKELDTALAECQSHDPILSGTLRLQICSASALMPRLLYGFRQQHPYVRYSITQNNDERTDYDFRITYAPNGSIPENAVPLLDEELLLAVPQNHPLASRHTINLIEAKDEEFLLLQQWQALRVQADSLCLLAGFAPKVIFQGDNPSTLREMVSLGMGVTFVPYVSWYNVIDQHLHLLHIASPICRRCLCIFSPPGQRMMAISSAFRQYAISYFDDFKKNVYANAL